MNGKEVTTLDAIADRLEERSRMALMTRSPRSRVAGGAKTWHTADDMATAR